MSIKKGQIYEGTVSVCRFPDKGIVNIDGSEVSVKGTLPGQKVSLRISKKRSGMSEGKLVEVTERSPLEDAEPVCEHFGECGGCTYQRLSYENQIRHKESMVMELLNRVYEDYEFEEIIHSPDIFRYRNKMEFSFGDECKDGPFALGMHRKGSFHDIVDLKDCYLVHADINSVRNAVREYFNDLYVSGEIDFNHAYSHRGYLRHLLIRRSVSTGQILIALITTTPDLSDSLDAAKEQEIVDGFKEAILNLERGGKLEGSIAGICHVYNNALSDTVKNDSTNILYGSDFITEHVLGLSFRISLFSFFQTNTKGAELLYSKAREYALEAAGERAEKCSVIYDLYSGTGTIAQLMSPAAEKVIGIEIVEDAVRSAKENAALNRIDNTEFIAGDVMKIICGEEGQDLPKPDLIILDPPREGVHPKALERISHYEVDNIVYISCKPTSLVHDLEVLKDAGYVLKKASCCDMFPQAGHVETVVLLTRQNT